MGSSSSIIGYTIIGLIVIIISVVVLVFRSFKSTKKPKVNFNKKH